MASLADCRWPDVGEPYATALRDAVEFALDRFDVMGVIACGSILRGNPGLTSDWDIHVIHTALNRQRIQRRFQSVPAEIFVNPPRSIRGYFRDEHENARPCTAHMFATGWIVLDRDAIVAELVAEAHTWLAKRPEPSASKLAWLRYAIVDLLDNATDVREHDPANAVMILNQAVAQTVEYVFWAHGRFQPRAKVMLAELAALDFDAAGLAHQYYTSGDISGRFDLAHQLAQQSLGVDTFFAWESPLEDVRREM